MLEDAMSMERRDDFALARDRGAAWDAQQARGIDALLALCAGLRALFGEPDVDERPLRGSDFRL
jgi:hypothetical protein